MINYPPPLQNNNNPFSLVGINFTNDRFPYKEKTSSLSSLVDLYFTDNTAKKTSHSGLVDL